MKKNKTSLKKVESKEEEIEMLLKLNESRKELIEMFDQNKNINKFMIKEIEEEMVQTEEKINQLDKDNSVMIRKLNKSREELINFWQKDMKISPMSELIQNMKKEITQTDKKRLKIS
jgi:hypothetical protein